MVATNKPINAIYTIYRRNTKAMYKKKILRAVFDICWNRFGQTWRRNK